jgi:glycolate oxidase iron-sulfur subunit
MRTTLPEELLATPAGRRAEEILRSCVHCGFCNATCPTYQLLGDELDGPRGRIYLIKEMLEQQAVTPVAVMHLDRCLTCRACETTCPSGVAYGELLEIGRGYQEQEFRRGPWERFVRGWLLRVVPDARAFRRWSGLGRLVRPLLGRRLAAQLRSPGPRSGGDSTREGERRGRVLLLDGCVQQVSTPEVNGVLEALLTGAGIEVLRLPEEGCCGGLALHLGQEARARLAMADNLDRLDGLLDQVDAVISSASGCGVTLKDYGRLLAQDPERAELAGRFAALVRDAGEFLWSLDVDWSRRRGERRVAVHVPCTLQHGQRCGDFPAQLLEKAGYEPTPVADPHLCCGSAGSYSILQGDLSEQLAKAKVAALGVGDPELIVSANVGCQLHLAGHAALPVVHWLELLGAPHERTDGVETA